MDEELLLRELEFKAVRSGGAGGQHVNKVATKVILRFDLGNSAALSVQEKTRLAKRLGNRLSADQILQVSSAATRSQHTNRDRATQRFLTLITKALQPEKPRKKTRPSPAAHEKRLDLKKKQAEKKSRRKLPPPQ